MVEVVDAGAVSAVTVAADGARGLAYRTLLGPAPGRRLTANLVEVAPAGVTRRHRHDWEQVNYILAGEGRLWLGDDVVHRVAAGTAVRIPGGRLHWFECDGPGPLVILGVLGPDAK